MTYELRDDPDDLPIICATEAEARRRGRQRAARIGQPVLIYEVETATANGSSARLTSAHAPRPACRGAQPF